MKKFFKVVTVSTMGLLFTMTNDIVAAVAGGAASSADSSPPAAAPIESGSMSLFSPMLDPLIESDKSRVLNQIAPHLHRFIDSKTNNALGPVSRGTPKNLYVKMTGPKFMEFRARRGYFDQTIGLEIYSDLSPAELQLPDGFLASLTGLRDLILTNLIVSSKDVDHLIARINGGLGHIKAMVVGGDSVRLWQHIVRPGTTCDLESIADAHQRLGNEFGIPYATNPHALAILALGLPKNNQYVVWAHERLAGKHNKRTMTIRTESGFLLGISPPTF